MWEKIKFSNSFTISVINTTEHTPQERQKLTQSW